VGSIPTSGTNYPQKPSLTGATNVGRHNRRTLQRCGDISTRRA